MKRIIISALALGLCLGASAQTWQDALLFTETNYSGTARGVAMGNALTAVGGDPGSITLNPAGSAVAAYSQFVITPGISISSTNVQASPYLDTKYMGDAVHSSYARVGLPNIGFIVNMNTGRRSGFKRMTMGMVLNQSRDFTGRMKASGRNDDNSYAASLASSADGFSPDVLAGEDWYYSGDPTRMPAWVDMAGYRAGLFDSVVGRDGAYLAITEIMDGDGNFRLAAPVKQSYGQQSFGSKNEAVFNYAMDFGDRFYVGVNLGVSSIIYGLNEYWTEAPENPSEFPAIEYSDGTSVVFNSLRMDRTYRLEGSGVYLKAGFLWRPVAGLRLGGAIQTPTYIRLRESYGYRAQVDLSGKYITPASSPEDEWDYAVHNPFRFNVGAAYAFGPFALVSADYEYANYGQANLASYAIDGSYSESSFQDVNLDISDLLGASHQLRLGAEVKVSPSVSLRAGYNLSTSPQHNYLYDNGNTVDVLPLEKEEMAKFARRSASVGAGFSFGSIFIDVAGRLRLMPDDYITPYYYYYAPNPAKFYRKVVDYAVSTPEVQVSSSYIDLLFTFGWRF